MRPACVRLQAQKAAGLTIDGETPLGVPILFLRCVLEAELFYPRFAIIIGNGDPLAVQLTDRHFRIGLRQAHGRFQAIPKYLPDDVCHPFAARVVKQCLPFSGRRIGNDHDMPAFPLQLVDRGKLLSVIQEQNVFPNDPALSLLLRAICGKVNGVLDKLAHLILQKELPSSSSNSHSRRRYRRMHVHADFAMSTSTANANDSMESSATNA